MCFYLLKHSLAFRGARIEEKRKVFSFPKTTPRQFYKATNQNGVTFLRNGPTRLANRSSCFSK